LSTVTRSHGELGQEGLHDSIADQLSEPEHLSVIRDGDSDDDTRR